MTGRRRLGLVAATSTLLAAAPLSSIFESWTWLMMCILAVGLISGAAVIARTLRFPTWAQAAGMAGVLLLVLTWMYPSGKEFLSLLPTVSTFNHFGALFMQAGSDTRSYGVPVPDREGLLFITVLGVGSVAIVVDLVTVVLRRPALAGLPMLAIYSVPVAIYVDDVPVLPFIIGAAGFLWLLVSDNVDQVRRFGRRFTGDGRDVDVWEPSPLAAAGRRLAVIGVAAAVILPLAVPGMTAGLLSRLTQSGEGVNGVGGGGGGSGRINLFASLSGQLTQTDTKEMLKVTTDEPNPFYLRIGIADQVTDQGVSSRSNSGRSIRTDPFPDPRNQSGTNQATFQQYRATIDITGLDQALAPLYTSPIGVNGLQGSWNYDQSAQALFSTRTTTKGRKYTIDYLRATYTPAALRTAPPIGSNVPAQLVSVPKDDMVSAKVAELTRGKTTQYDKVRAIYDYFSRSNGFIYSLQTESGTSGTDIDSFLKNKAGYCQQYAAAMTWMVRAAGFPARVAFGFTRGASTDGRTFSITNRNAHAWTEVYFAGYGWVPFDATPASAIAGASRTGWAPDTDAPAPTTVTAPGSSAAGADPSSSAGEARNPGRELNDPSLGGTAAKPTNDRSLVLLIVGLAALLIALLLTPALRRAMLRRHRHHLAGRKPARASSGGSSPPGSESSGSGSGSGAAGSGTAGSGPGAGPGGGPGGGPGSEAAGSRAGSGSGSGTGAASGLRSGSGASSRSDISGSRDIVVTVEAIRERTDAHAAWDELIDTMIDYRMPVDPAETPRHTARRLATESDLPAGAAESATLLGSVEERARYARQPQPGGPELADALRQVRRGLAGNANWRIRLAAVFMPPSVLLRWRLAVGDTSANWVTAIGKARDWFLRWSPRRLLPRPRAREQGAR